MRNPNVASLRGEDVWRTLLKAPADAPIIPQIVIDLKTQLYNCANRLVSALITRPKGGGRNGSLDHCATDAIDIKRVELRVPCPVRHTLLGRAASAEKRNPPVWVPPS